MTNKRKSIVLSVFVIAGAAALAAVFHMHPGLGSVALEELGGIGSRS
jgi:hypothetical protein